MIRRVTLTAMPARISFTFIRILLGAIFGFILSLVVLGCLPNWSACLSRSTSGCDGSKIDSLSSSNSLISFETLQKEVRVLCCILTGPSNQNETLAIKSTWAKHCNKYVFMSSEEDPSLPAIKLLNVHEGRDWLWAKTRAAFRYLYDHHLNDFDWFLKAYDDTYVIVENLRYMLLDHEPIEPIYFGSKFKSVVPQGHMSGSAGYVLSREALRKFVEIGLSNPTNCSSDHNGNEDTEMGKCLYNAGVKAGDSRDNSGKHRFLPFVATYHLNPYQVPYDRDDSYYPIEQGMACCSNYSISFHNIPAQDMYVMDYFIYHFKVHGVT